MNGSAPPGATVDLTLRVPAEQLDRLAAAAHLANVDVADFILAATKEAVDEALSGERVVLLSPADADMVVATLDEPPPAPKALRRLMSSNPPWRVPGDDRR